VPVSLICPTTPSGHRVTPARRSVRHMARTWLQVRVELVSGMGMELDQPPGRIFAVAPSLTFARLAEDIDTAFGRWDRAHLHVFELPDGRQIGVPDDDPGEDAWLDDSAAKLGTELAPGDEFAYTFDLGEEWRHRCAVLSDKVDARELFGETPPGTVILEGWGWLPDQYGRETAGLDQD
jgi:hypothetical protein